MCVVKVWWWGHNATVVKVWWGENATPIIPLESLHRTHQHQQQKETSEQRLQQ